MRIGWTQALFATAALAACAQSGGRVPSVAPVAETAATTQSDANTAIVIPNAQGGLIVGSSESGGVELYNLSGERRAQIAAGAAVGLDARPNGNGWTVAALDGATNRLRLFELNADAASATERTVRDIPIGFSGESLCLYRDARDQTLYAFALGAAAPNARWSLRQQHLDVAAQNRVAHRAEHGLGLAVAREDHGGRLHLRH